MSGIAWEVRRRAFVVTVLVGNKIAVHLKARDAEHAIFAAHERVTMDVDPTTFLETRVESAIDRSPGQLKGGRVLTPEEIAYCNGRGYGTGCDTDGIGADPDDPEHDGALQWLHLVDDGVAFCRTTALWFWGPGVTTTCAHASSADPEKSRVSCPWCLQLLVREMRYKHLDLQVRSRREGRFGVAKTDTDNRDVWLTVNGVEIARATMPATDGGAPAIMERYQRVAARINEGPKALRINEGVPCALPASELAAREEVVGAMLYAELAPRAAKLPPHCDAGCADGDAEGIECRRCAGLYELGAWAAKVLQEGDAQ